MRVGGSAKYWNRIEIYVRFECEMIWMSPWNVLFGPIKINFTLWIGDLFGLLKFSLIKDVVSFAAS